MARQRAAARECGRQVAVEAQPVVRQVVHRAAHPRAIGQRDLGRQRHREAVARARIALHRGGEEDHGQRQRAVHQRPNRIGDQAVQRQRPRPEVEQHADGNGAQVQAQHRPLRRREAPRAAGQCALGRDAELHARKDEGQGGPGERREARHVVLLDEQAAPVAAAHFLEDPERQRVIGQEVEQEVGGRGHERQQAAEQHHRRRKVEDGLLPAVEVGHHRGQVVELLRPAQSAMAQDALHAPDVHGALPPAHPLTDEGLDRFRRQAEGQRLGVVDRPVALRMQAHRGVQVFGDGAGGEAADLVECAAPHHGATAAEEGGVPVVLAALNDAKEQRLLGPHRAPCAAPAVLERVEVVEVLRRLHEAQLGVVEVAQRAGQEVAPGCVVGVEDGDQLTAAAGQRMVQIAGLGVLVVGARQVLAAELTRQRPHLRPAPVVEQPGGVRVVHGPRGEQRLAHQRDRLVVGGHEDVDAEAHRGRRGLAIGEAPAHEDVQQGGAEAEHLGAVHEP